MRALGPGVDRGARRDYASRGKKKGEKDSGEQFPTAIGGGENTAGPRIFSKTHSVRDRAWGNAIDSTVEIPVRVMRVGPVEYWFATRSEMGKGPSKIENQDSHIASMPFDGQADTGIFAVLDGHGEAGRLCSQFVMDKLPENISSDLKAGMDLHAALTSSFKRTHFQLSKSRIDASLSGTTAVLCYVKGSRIVCANAGDSRAVLARGKGSSRPTPVELSHDHKPDTPSEKKRIESRGGRVEPFLTEDGEFVGPHRVWINDEPQCVPGLAMSRSIGDKVAASVGVSCEPEIIEYDVDPARDDFFIVACDGVWEVMSNKEVVEFVKPFDDPAEAAHNLVEEAFRRWKIEEDDVADDITAVVVKIRPVSTTDE